MFILEDRRRKPVARFSEEPGVLWHLLVRGEANKYPMWHLLDDASPTWFSSDRMAELIADLERLQSAEEIHTRQLRWKRSLEDGIAKLEAAAPEGTAGRGPRRAPVPSGPTLEWMRECVRQSETQPPLFPESLRAEVVVPHIGSIISLARRCRQIKGFLGHDPFANL